MCLTPWSTMLIESMEAAAFSISSDASESPLRRSRASSDHRCCVASLNLVVVVDCGEVERLLRLAPERVKWADFRERGAGGGRWDGDEFVRRRLPRNRMISRKYGNSGDEGGRPRQHREVGGGSEPDVNERMKKERQ